MNISAASEIEKTQPKVFLFLKNNLEKSRLAHALLFEGDRGTGKVLVSTFLSQAIFCENQDGVLPCGTCTNCRRIADHNHPDVYHVEPDGLSIKKEQIKSLHDEFQKKSVETNKKVYIIKDAEKMTSSAANSLLKFIEEPHQGTTVLLLTEHPQQILPTIISRCQIVPFQPLNTNQLVEELINHGVVNSKAKMLAQISNGIEEAVRLSKDDWFAQAQKIVLELMEGLRNPYSALLIIQEQWMTHFKERNQHEQGLELLLYYYRDLLLMRLGKNDEMLNQGMESKWQMVVTSLSEKQLTDKILFILKAIKKLEANTNPQLVLEQLVINLQEGFSVA